MGSLTLCIQKHGGDDFCAATLWRDAVPVCDLTGLTLAAARQLARESGWALIER